MSIYSMRSIQPYHFQLKSHSSFQFGVFCPILRTPNSGSSGDMVKLESWFQTFPIAPDMSNELRNAMV